MHHTDDSSCKRRRVTHAAQFHSSTLKDWHGLIWLINNVFLCTTVLKNKQNELTMIHGSNWPQKGMRKLYISQGMKKALGA